MGDDEREYLSIRLGHEELVILLGILKASTLPGLEDDLLEGLSEEQKEASLATAERSLRARGIINFDEEDERIKVEPLTLALLGTCVYPQSTTSVMVLDKMGDIKAGYYHSRDDFLVEHSFRGDGIYQFTTAAGREDMEKRYFDLLGFEKRPVPEDKPFEAPISGMEEMREIVRKGERDKLAEILGEKGVNGEAAEKVVRLFEESRRSLMITRVDYGATEEDLNAEGMAFLDGSEGIWAISGDPENADIMMIEPVSLEKAKSRAGRLIARKGA